MSDTIYLGKPPLINPITKSDYQRMILPHALVAKEIQKRVSDVSFWDKIKPLKKTDIHDNNAIASGEDIEHAKKELIGELQKLEQLTGKNKHIIIVADKCFTNRQLIILIKDILGKENFKRFVKIVNINYEAPADVHYLEENLATNHSLFIFGGSLSDPHSMHPSHHNSPPSKMVKEIADPYASPYLNKRAIVVCFANQDAANNIGNNDTGITATLQGPAQFGPSNCNILRLKYVNRIFSEVLAGLTNNSTNSNFSSVFTRSGYVNFNLLNAEGNLGVIPLIQDHITSGIVGWGSKNGNITGVQFHPEISFLTKTHDTRKHLKEILPSDTRDKFLNNFDVAGIIKRDIGEAFYVFAMLAYIKDINQSHAKILAIGKNQKINDFVGYMDCMDRIRQLFSRRVNFIIEDHAHLEIQERQKKLLDKMDQEGVIKFLTDLDWQVGRDEREASKMAGLKSMASLIKEHHGLVLNKLKVEKKNYIVRDLGAGDGSTIKNLYEKVHGRDIIYYGTGDYLYFDLFAAVNIPKFSKTIPKELRVLFVEKVVATFKQLDGDLTLKRLNQAIEQATFSKDDTIMDSSMTNKKTSMFASEKGHPLSMDIQANFEKNLVKLNRLGKYITTNIYTLFSGYLERIYISKFNDLYIDDNVISQIDFQYSIRATSHVGGREWMKIISEHCNYSAKLGSIFIDNGVNQSYTSIPRLKELHNISTDITSCDFKLVYNRKTNSFSSVIITHGTPYGEAFWKKHLDKDHVIVSVKEAYDATFFKLEYFIRTFIVSGFRNNIVFRDFNDQIVDTLTNIMHELKNGRKDNIPNLILTLINHIARNYKNINIHYDEINKEELERYNIDGEYLHNILGPDISLPKWLNTEAHRVN